MSPIEVGTANAICTKCGIAYGRRKGFFPVSYATLYKGIGYTSVCKECIDKMYSAYLSVCNDPKMAVRQVCRKLDLYWNETVYAAVDKKATTRTMMTAYIAKINTVSYSGKSYDDTLTESGALWDFGSDSVFKIADAASQGEDEIIGLEAIDITPDIVEFWGPGMPASEYAKLEQRRNYWNKKLAIDIGEDFIHEAGTEALVRQICNIEVDINRDRAAGKQVTTSVNTLNSLLGSASLRPTQKKDDTDVAAANTPFGVWVKRWEDQRPIPEPDPEMQDVDGIIKYITVWFFGHLCKMLGIRNSYCKLYEDEIAKMRIDKPEYEDEDDDTMLFDIFGTDGEQE